MGISNELRARMFAAYYGCEMQVQPYARNAGIVPGKMVGLTDALCFVKIVGWQSIADIPFDRCKLQLYVLPDITDDDAIEVAKLATEWENAAPLLAEDVSEWISEIMSGNCALTADYVSGRELQSLIDLLRSKSYDVGYGDIPSLIDAGVAVSK